MVSTQYEELLELVKIEHIPQFTKWSHDNGNSMPTYSPLLNIATAPIMGIEKVIGVATLMAFNCYEII